MTKRTKIYWIIMREMIFYVLIDLKYYLDWIILSSKFIVGPRIESCGIDNFPPLDHILPPNPFSNISDWSATHIKSFELSEFIKFEILIFLLVVFVKISNLNPLKFVFHFFWYLRFHFWCLRFYNEARLTILSIFCDLTMRQGFLFLPIFLTPGK